MDGRTHAVKRLTTATAATTMAPPARRAFAHARRSRERAAALPSPHRGPEAPAGLCGFPPPAPHRPGPLLTVCSGPRTYRSWRRPGSVGQRVSGAVHPPVDEIGSRTGDDGASPDIHGDAHHAVGGDCGRGGACHGHLGSARGLEVGRSAARGVHRWLGVVGVGRPPAREREGVSSES